jgi:AcrR family transcriptional regulator
MRRPAWGGLPPPRDDAEARGRLLEATRRCIERVGPERTTLGDVAAEARVTRQTVYRYFRNGDELLRAAFVMAAGGILERVTEHARRFEHPGQRIVEAFLYLWREIPADPHLAPIFAAGEGERGAGPTLLSEFAVDVSRSAFRALHEDWSPLSFAEVDELAELMMRLLESFLLEPGPRPRGDAELRAFLRRWLLPATGLRDA